VLLPNADRAEIDVEKLREYLLSSTHPVGRLKAMPPAEAQNGSRRGRFALVARHHAFLQPQALLSNR
jgi:hypothetical protein